MEDKKEVKAIEIEVVILLVILALVVLGPATLSYLETAYPALESSTGYVATYGPIVGSVAKSALGILVGISIPISVFFLIVIIYCVEQLKHIRKKEAEKFDAKVEPAYEANVTGDPALSHRWETVKAHIGSANPNDWRQAILEADVILEDILTGLGYRGEGVGEKLKRVEPGDMKSLNEAWEGHKVRNLIAHEGSQFAMTHHEANRVINLYKKVFEEFYYIQ